MKEPLLSLDPAPDAEAAGYPDSLSLSRHAPASAGPEEPEPLIDPRILAALHTAPRPGRPRRRIPVSWVVLSLSGASVLLMGVLIGMKISDYQHLRYFERRYTQHPAPQSTPSSLSGTPASGAPLAASSLPSPPAGSALSSSLPPGQAPAAPDPSAGPDFSGELAALRQERQMVSQRFGQLNSSAPGAVSPSTASPSPSPSWDTAMAAATPPKAVLSTEETRIRDAPALARVREYDADWHFVVLDGGKERNITPGTQLAVRRGHEILGLIRVDEVLENESVAELQGEWKANAQAPKPRRGDDVVTYPLF